MIPNILSNSDCLNFLERVPTSAITMIYLDPPWNMNKRFGFEFDNNTVEDYDSYFSKVVQQLHRILIEEGSLLFHADPKYSKSLINMLDEVFGRDNFRNEYILPKRRINSRISSIIHHESIFFYSKSDNFTYNEPTRSLTKNEIESLYPYSDTNGRYRLESLLAPNKRPSLGSIWDDIPLRLSAQEKVNYFSQQPLMLLERVIEISSNTGDTILDPFSGSGTTVIAAEKLGRQWMGCDNNKEAIDISIERLKNLKLTPGQNFTYIDNIELNREYPVVHNFYVKLRRNDLHTSQQISFVINEPVNIEETRYNEFKEVKGNNPIRSIVDVVDQYAVAFLNCEGGSIYWGIRDSDRFIVGVKLNYSQRDAIRRTVDDKLSSIQPRVALSGFRITFHEVLEGNKPIEDLFVLQVDIPHVDSRDLYFTGQNEAYLKTDGGKKKLSGPEIQQEVLKRHT